ncbi:MAG TPA: radical SAM protein, partial [Kiritimatiellae bacterium]|nr:radical SAM protein [Kiritimatiellia bacterium]
MSVPCTDCYLEAGGSTRQWMDGFRRSAARLRIPVSGMMELTRRCNLECIHCYQQGQRQEELPTDLALTTIHELGEAGTLFLTLTGGEPLLHPDFGTIYLAARKRGMLVSVFTNGTLVTTEHFGLWRRFPPRLVEVSLYGAAAETHDAITGQEGSFECAMATIKKLLECGISVGLKTVILRRNLGEVAALGRRASALGVPFRVDPLVFAYHQGGGVSRLRAAAREAVGVELADRDRRRQWRIHAARAATNGPRRLYRCGAGLTGFFIDARGRLAPCALAVHRAVALKDGGFPAAWRQLQGMQRIPSPADYACDGCSWEPWCSGCPALSWCELGDETQPVPYACQIARA